jgi:paraquat-inducible protein A
MPAVRRDRGSRRTALLLLCLSLALNVTALFVPFLRVDAALGGDELYSLPRSVILLWGAGLHLLAVLVAVFSIAFPFGKLAVLFRAALAPDPPEAHRSRVERVGRLGRWSMLDVFLAALLLGLTNDRFFIDTEPRIGLPLFALAVALSLVAGELLEARGGEARSRPPRRASAGERLLLLVTWISFAVGFASPFVQIDDWRLRNDTFSLLGLSGALWAASLPVGFLVATFVVAVPLCELAALTVSAVAAPRRALLAAALRRRLARWSMLEVFVLALAIFLVEGRAFVRTELRSGTLLLSVALALHLLARGALEARLRRRAPGA